MTSVTSSILSTQDVAYSTRNEKANVERDVTVSKETGPVAIIVTDSSTLISILFSIHELMKDHDSLDVLPSV